MAVKSNIQYKKIEIDIVLPDIIQIMGIEVENMKIFNIHIPPNSALRDTHLRAIAGLLIGSWLLIGDVNALNPLWVSSRNNNKERLFDLLLEEIDCAFINDVNIKVGKYIGNYTMIVGQVTISP
ncbi:hypothetical protein HHI36_023641 [Cryptolaemus montrouzieri]|uniref:RNA-directed DNA polymerase from mobile element jockey-like n=1 Tax=Cryptolaemus montrouzieri TaxID=559131 RepID=A0ABD2PHN7_9CUCU